MKYLARTAAHQDARMLVWGDLLGCPWGSLPAGPRCWAAPWQKRLSNMLLFVNQLLLLSEQLHHSEWHRSAITFSIVLENAWGFVDCL